MVWKRLLNPTPRSKPIKYQPFEWAEAKIQILSEPDQFGRRTLADVMSMRRTKRSFKSVDIVSLSKILWLTSRVQARAKSELGFELSKRPALSSGAIHPIHILVLLNRNEGWWRYDPNDHSLVQVAEDMSDWYGLNDAVKDVIDPQEGIVMLFVAEPGKTSAKYLNAESLVWRDAGVLLAMLALAAEAEDMSFCPLGITGDPWASSLDKEGRLLGIGMAILGGSANLS